MANRKKMYSNVQLMATPEDELDVVNRKYVDNAISKKVKNSVVAVATSNLPFTYASATKTLTQDAAAPLVIDGETIKVGDRVLIAGQTIGGNNGIYVMTTLGTAETSVGADDGVAAVLTRADDMDDTADLSLNMMVNVQRGTQNADTTWVMTNDTVPTLGTDAISFSKLKGADGANSFTTTIEGDGSKKEFPIEHGLGTENVNVSIVDASTKEQCIFGVKIDDGNNVTIFSDVLLESTDRFIVTVLG